MKRCWYLWVVLFVYSPVASAGNILCPLKPDPPPAIDGNLSEWYQSPGGFEIEEENVTWGKAKWQGEADLSGTLWLYWDKNFIYLAADIVDDVFIQDKSGKDLWLGDHLEFDLDPEYKPGAKGIFTDKQFMMGFSPGNLQNTGDPLFDMLPEYYIWAPADKEDANINVAALRTEKGYTLEARIPWGLFGIKPKQGMILGIDLHISDTDTPGSQDTYTTLFPEKWTGRKLERLIPVKLGDTSGK